MAVQPKISPHLWFEKDAKKAAEFYVSVFSARGVARILSARKLYDTPSGTVEIVEFELIGQHFLAISAGPLFKFNEAISFVIHCDTQEEIDYYWSKLSADPNSEQCGWLKDKFGLSWQVTPRIMGKLLADPDEKKVARVTQAFLQMKKFDLEALIRAYEGK